MTDGPEAGPVVKVARDLSEIERMAAELEAEAADDSNSPLMPGGKAMVSLAPVANLEAWENRYETAERLGMDTTYITAEDDEWEPPLQTLTFWSEQWRREHGAEYGQRATIASEANFLRYLLGWAWDHEPHFDDFAHDIRRARLRLEDVVHDGRRAERTRVTCPHCSVERTDEETGETTTVPGPRLIRIYAWNPSDDGYKCPTCKHRYTEDDYQRAYANQLRSEGAERYVAQPEAIATLRTQGRPERTIRKWLLPSAEREDVVIGYCEVRTRRTFLWWPDLWHRHLITPTRKRSA